MSLTKNVLWLTSLIVFFLISPFPVKAEPRGTPTIVTNDSSVPISVTGTVTSSTPYLYKPIGVTSATLAGNKSTYELGLACANEYSGSRMCSSQELILAPGAIAVGEAGLYVMSAPMVFTDPDLRDFSFVTAYSDVGALEYRIYIGADYVFRSNQVTNSTTARPVACCAP